MDLNLDIEGLREVEAACIAKFQAKAKALREADPRMNPGIARAKACELMPNTTSKYLEAVQRLTFCGCSPKTWK